MQFPAYIHLGPLALHPHWVFETLAYFVGFRVYLRLRARTGDHLAAGDRWWVVAAAAVGAALGSKLLYWFEDPAVTLARWRDPVYLMAGKSIVGGLIGGLVAVEWVKRRIGVTRSTGDLFAVPLALGVAIGRIGCFLTGLDDHTHGLPTGLPWGVDFGDGLARHPAQLYELAFLLLLAAALARLGPPQREGDRFKAFMAGYTGFRLLVDFIKPGVPLGGLTAIQWACLAVLVYYGRDLPRIVRWREAGARG